MSNVLRVLYCHARRKSKYPRITFPFKPLTNIYGASTTRIKNRLRIRTVAPIGGLLLCDGDFEEAAFAYLYDAAAGDFYDAVIYAFAVHFDGALSN